jgi:foldase protein PrsA
MAFCAAIATAVVLGACGSGVPGNAVATVGGATITKAAFQHWLVVSNNLSRTSNTSPAPPLPDPPSYTGCVAGERKLTSTTETTAQLTALCKQAYQALLGQVMPLLIEAVWIQGEAYDMHVKVTPAQVEKAYISQRAKSVPSLATTAELNTFLAKSGYTVADLKWRTYLNLLLNAIELKVQKQALKVTNAQIAAYYHKHLSALTVPETRDVHLIETNTAAAAATVKSDLQSGSTYAELAPKYSIDPTSKAAGGKLVGVRPGELNTQLSAAIFAAKIGVLTGPIKTAFGYYVFTVDSSTPASVPSLKAATPGIRSTLTSSQASAAEAKLSADFTKTWVSRTTCASGYIVAQACGNAPKTSTSSSSTTPATGATG